MSDTALETATATGAKARGPRAPKPQAPPGFGGMIGAAPAMRRLFEQIERVAPTEVTVLIVGESGTGKEAVAQALHALSPRAAQRFMPVNCGAIPPNLIEAELLGHEKGSFTGAERRRAGYFERAHGGTIFLDEIGEMPLDMQVKLLRVLENRSFQRVGGTELIEVDVRVIAATNRDLDSAVHEGRFREDLMYRLAVFPLLVPPLRKRGEDAQLIAQHFLDRLNEREGTRKTFSRSSLKALSTGSWPGNVRELKNAVHRAFIMADHEVELVSTAAGSRRARPMRTGDVIRVTVGTPLAEAQRELIFAALEHYKGDKRRAARALGVSVKTLYNRLETYRSGALPEDSSA
jgi:DNA-binding NtrC family response regulator